MKWFFEMTAWMLCFILSITRYRVALFLSYFGLVSKEFMYEIQKQSYRDIYNLRMALKE